MKPVKHMTDAELKYAASDLRQAIAVTSPSRNSNMDRYLADYRAVIGEQEARDRKRVLRRNILDMPGDLLLVQTKTRKSDRAIVADRWFSDYDSRYHRVRTLHTARRIYTGQDVRTKRGRSAMFSLYFGSKDERG